MPELSPKYDPKSVEPRVFEAWTRGGYTKSDPSAPGEAFSIVIPPPNVTGVLHVGHALGGTIQDTLTRWRRMQGRNALWLPGADHAGIGTQHVVERDLRKRGIDPRAIGRDEFLEHIWKWKEDHGSTIVRQIKSMGFSCDFTRWRFTMDEGLSRAVNLVFKSLFDEGLIYRGNYLVNWSTKLQTALSDDEVEHREVKGSLWHLRYPYADGTGHAVVATTRPETMLGDTAVAVNPGDERHRARIGTRVRLPLVNREIPVIADEFVKPEFGTGMVKVTPAHDPNDYEMGKRHNLEFINLMNPDGTTNANAGAYAGLSMEEARKRVVADLEAQGLVEKIEPYAHSVGHCYRSGCVVEPYISKQWFVRMRPLAEPALQAVREGRTRFIPDHWSNTYFQWLENVRDWCISRQLVWGHRIPVFNCESCGHQVCEIERPPERCPKCAAGGMIQDPDVLDTWFSSALWPFSTMGWPEKTPDLARYYPTSVLVTAHDIIFFWVARMMMMGLKFMGDVPFREVFITPLIMAEGGGKMSKSKGNAVDPVQIAEEYGADSVRITLASHAAQARTVSLSMKRFEGYRNFTNKLWNAARFVLMNAEDLTPEDFAAGPDSLNPADLALEDRWIRSQLREASARATLALESYMFDQYTLCLYDFAWKQDRDWYLEFVKPRLYASQKPGYSDAERASRRAAQIVMVSALEGLMRLLHPVAPFLTEEIWGLIKERFGGPKGPDALRAPSLMVVRWPRPEELGTDDPEADAEIALVQEVIGRVRQIRGEMNVPPANLVDVEVVTRDSRKRELLQRGKTRVLGLVQIGRFAVVPDASEMAFASTSIFDDVTIRVPLPPELREAEAARLGKTLDKLRADIERSKKKLGDESFAARAPAAVVEAERERVAKNEQELETLASKLRALR